jgi:hypothetical protein
VVADRVFADQSLPVLEMVQGAPVGENNNQLWFRTHGGYVHSSWVQLVNDTPAAPEAEATANAGFWAEVCVPWAPVQFANNDLGRVYYASVYRVVGYAPGQDGTAWYRINDGLRGGGLVPTRALQRIPDDAMSPLSPGASKRIDLDLKTSLVRAFEGKTQVWEAQCATGDVTKRRGTPAGSFYINGKFVGQHMVGALGTSEAYSLPGVPFVSYFTLDGVAFHGAYWHFDWGARRSHGCVNLTPDDARWVWRWSEMRRVNVGTSRRPRVVWAGTPVGVRG